MTGNVQLEAPTLLIYELTNAIWASTRRDRVPAALATRALDHLLACRIPLHPPQPERTLAVSLEHGIPGYDAAYVALADSLGVPLWTGDRKLHRAMRAGRTDVRWIADYASEA